MSKDSSYLNLKGIIVYNKEEDETIAVGLDCNFKFDDVIGDDDKQLMKLKIQKLISKLKSVETHKSGYLALQEYYDQLLYYYNFGNWIVFLSLKSDSIISFFPRFTEIMLILRKEMLYTKGTKELINAIQIQLLPDSKLFACENCDIKGCLPALTYTNIELELR